MSEIPTGASAGVEHKVVELDWSDDPIRCPGPDALPATDPNSVQAVTARARVRALRAIQEHVAAGWVLDGVPEEAITLERRKRQVLLPTPGTMGPEWEEFCAVQVRLCRG